LDLIVAASAGCAVPLIALAINQLLAGRRHRRDLESRRWDQIIEWARIIERNDESDLTRAVAHQALASMGITEASLQDLKRRQHNKLVGDLFSNAPVISRDDQEVVESALRKPARPVSTEIAGLVRVLMALDSSVASYRRLPEGGGSIRTFFVLTLFVFAFVALVVKAVVVSLP